jgi:hypothetical protein
MIETLGEVPIEWKPKLEQLRLDDKRASLEQQSHSGKIHDIAEDFSTGKPNSAESNNTGGSNLGDRTIVHFSDMDLERTLAEKVNDERYLRPLLLIIKGFVKSCHRIA